MSIEAFKLTKIHELPRQIVENIKDSDIAIIENELDTYHISIGDLKSIFSCDNKLQAMYESLMEIINNFGGSVQSLVVQFDEFLKNYEAEINALHVDINKNAQNIVEIKSEISNILNSIELIDQRVESLELRMQNVETEIENHNTQITNIKNIIEQQDIDIKALKEKDIDLQVQIDILKQQIQNIITDIDGMGAVSEELVNSLINEINIKIDNKYTEIMQILDDKFHQTPIIA